MTPAQLSAAREVCKKRTPGEWEQAPDTHAGRVWVQRGKRFFADDCEPLFDFRSLAGEFPREKKLKSYAQREHDAAYIAATTHPETGYEAALVEIERLRKMLSEKEAPGE